MKVEENVTQFLLFASYYHWESWQLLIKSSLDFMCKRQLLLTAYLPWLQLPCVEELEQWSMTARLKCCSGSKRTRISICPPLRWRSWPLLPLWTRASSSFCLLARQAAAPERWSFSFAAKHRPARGALSSFCSTRPSLRRSSA